MSVWGFWLVQVGLELNYILTENTNDSVVQLPQPDDL